MSDPGRRTVQRILRSRVLPLLTVLLLFTGLVSIAGYLLWQTRIKQEIPIVGELIVQKTESAIPDGFAPKKSMVLRIHHGDDVSFLTEGDTLQIEMTAASGRAVSLGAKVVRLDTEVPFREMILNPEGAAAERFIGNLRERRVGKTGPVEMTLIVRKQRLLMVALQRGKVN